MEINDQPNEKSRIYLFKNLFYTERELATVTCILTGSNVGRGKL